MLLACAAARPLNALAMGDGVGKPLGTNIAGTRVLVVLAVTLLAGGTTALAGPHRVDGAAHRALVRWPRPVQDPCLCVGPLPDPDRFGAAQVGERTMIFSPSRPGRTKPREMVLIDNGRTEWLLRWDLSPCC